MKRVLEVIRTLQRQFDGSRLFLEIVPALKDPATPQRDADFLAEILQRTGCGWLLNLAEIDARSRNVGFDPYDHIAEVLPAAASLVIRLASVRFEKRIGAVVTTTEGAIPDEIWSLLRHTLVLGSHKARAVVVAGREPARWRDAAQERPAALPVYCGPGAGASEIAAAESCGAGFSDAGDDATRVRARSISAVTRRVTGCERLCK